METILLDHEQFSQSEKHYKVQWNEFPALKFQMLAVFETSDLKEIIEGSLLRPVEEHT